MAEKRKIVLEAEVKAALTGAKEVTDKIQNFKDQMDSIEMPKDVGKNLEKA